MHKKNMRVVRKEAVLLTKGGPATIAIYVRYRQTTYIHDYSIHGYFGLRSTAEEMTANWLTRSLIRRPIVITQEAGGFTLDVLTTVRRLDLGLLLVGANCVMQSMTFGYSWDMRGPEVVLLVSTFSANKLKMRAEIQCPRITVPVIVLEGFLKELRSRFIGAKIERTNNTFNIVLPERYNKTDQETTRRNIALFFQGFDAMIPR